KQVGKEILLEVARRAVGYGAARRFEKFKFLRLNGQPRVAQCSWRSARAREVVQIFALIEENPFQF
ncbi:hypothetical protein A2U01_0090378, partial [Trifolium medium]|nr:hypothetical protein [Trifolium medium]